MEFLLFRTRPRDDDPMPNEEYRKKNQLFTDYKFKALESFVQLRSLYYRVQNRTEQVINNCKAETARKQLATGNGNTANVTSHLLLIAVPLLLATL